MRRHLAIGSDRDPRRKGAAPRRGDRDRAPGRLASPPRGDHRYLWALAAPLQRVAKPGDRPVAPAVDVGAQEVSIVAATPERGEALEARARVTHRDARDPVSWRVGPVGRGNQAYAPPSGHGLPRGEAASGRRAAARRVFSPQVSRLFREATRTSAGPGGPRRFHAATSRDAESKASAVSPTSPSATSEASPQPFSSASARPVTANPTTRRTGLTQRAAARICFPDRVVYASRWSHERGPSAST